MRDKKAFRNPNSDFPFVWSFYKHREILHIDMDAFFASVEQQTFPFLRGKPIAVCGNPEGRSVIASASYEAKVCGVKSGMNLYQAKQLCPELLLVPLNPAKYVDTAKRIINILIQFTDLVEVFSIDEAFLDVTNTNHLFGGSENLALQIKAAIYQELGLTCSIGIAHNKLLAKYASDQCKPNGLVRIRSDAVPKLLEKLPVTELCGIGERLALRLKELGIITAGDLAKCPTQILIQHFGKDGIKLKNMGLGFDPSPVRPYWFSSDAKSVGNSCTMEKDTSDLKVIKDLLWKLSLKVGRRLRQNKYQGRTITLVLRYDDFTTRSIQKSVKEFIADSHKIFKLSFSLFQQLYQPERKVRLLGVSVSNLIKRMTQLTFAWSDQEENRTDSVLDQLDDKYGEFVVRWGVLSDLPKEAKVIAPSWRPKIFPIDTAIPKNRISNGQNWLNF